SPLSTTPAASCATASSSSRKTSTPWCGPSAPPSTNAASPSNCSSTTARSTAPRRSPSSAPASAASCAILLSATPPPRNGLHTTPLCFLGYQGGPLDADQTASRRPISWACCP